jgi:hypothetical protein
LRSFAGRSGEGLPHPEERAQHASRRTRKTILRPISLRNFVLVMKANIFVA